MKLHSTITSAFARKVWIVAYETGVIDRIERIPTNPHTDQYLLSDNPLCRIPTLVLSNGEVLFNSPVICEYLDSLHDGPKLFPASGSERWFALKLQALGDGILDTNMSRRSELMRPLGGRDLDLIEHRKQALEASYTWLDDHIHGIKSRPFSIGHIAIGCALGYSLVAFPNEMWWVHYKRLAAWHTQVEERASMIATRYETLKATLSPELIKEGPASQPLL